MSAKNKPAAKKIRSLERALRKGRLPRYFDLVTWALDRKLAQSKSEVIKLIFEKRIVCDSHPLGKRVVEVGPEDEPQKIEIVDTRVPIQFKEHCEILPEGVE